MKAQVKQFGSGSNFNYSTSIPLLTIIAGLAIGSLSCYTINPFKNGLISLSESGPLPITSPSPEPSPVIETTNKQINKSHPSLFKAELLGNENQTPLTKQINEYRQTHGKKPLKQNNLLMAGAYNRAKYIYGTSQWSHANYKQAFIDSGYTSQKDLDQNYIDIGENLAKGNSSSFDPFAAWLASPSHLAIINGSEWREIGVASYENITVTWFGVRY